MRWAHVVLLSLILVSGLRAQEEFWNRDPIDLRLGLNNGIRKLFVEFRAEKGKVPFVRVRSRLIDPENLGKEVFTDIVTAGSYIYQGTEHRQREGDDFLVHSFSLSGNKRLRVSQDIKSLSSITLRELVFNKFDVGPDNLPFALLEVIEGSRVLTYPLRDISKWKGKEEAALLVDDVPMEKTADRIEALRYCIKKLIVHEEREKRLEALRQIGFYSDEELDRAVGILLQLREDKDPKVAKAVHEFCIKRHFYSQQELMMHLHEFRGDLPKNWEASLDFLDKIPARDAARDAAPALKHFLRKENLDPKLAQRAELKLAAYRKILPPGAEDAPLPKVSKETGWIPILEGEILTTPREKDADPKPKNSPKDEPGVEVPPSIKK